MPEWLIQNCRLTVFVTPDTIVPSTLWPDIIGEQPENSIVQRATATKTENGPFGDGTLSLLVQPMRIDWIYQTIPDWTATPTLGPFPAAAEQLLQLSRRWAKGNTWFPSISRIALGLVLMYGTPDRSEGYRELRRFIDGVPNTSDATDFLYQINRPRSSLTSIGGLQVNRLSKWSVGAYLLGVISMGNTEASHNMVNSPLQTHVRLELDISTSANFQAIIPRESTESVIDDLFKGAQEICEKGNRF